MMQKLEKFLMPVANALSKNKVLSAIRDGFLITVPITIVGSIFLLIANFPLEGFLNMMTSIFGAGWDAYLGRVSAIAFDCVALLGVLSIGYCYAREKGLENRIGGAVVALVCFLIITPQKTLVEVEGAAEAASFSGFQFTFLGTAGMFLAMITAILSVEIYAWAIRKKLVIKMPDGVPPAVMESFASLIPSAIAMTVFFVIGIIFDHTSFEYVHYFIYRVLQAPLVGLGRLSGFEVIYQFLSTLFWFFGINGPAVTNTIFSPIHKVLTVENYEAAQAGLEMTNIFTAGFSDFFCNFGGGRIDPGSCYYDGIPWKIQPYEDFRKAVPAGRHLRYQRAVDFRSSDCIEPADGNSFHPCAGCKYDYRISGYGNGYYADYLGRAASLDLSHHLLGIPGDRFLHGFCCPDCAACGGYSYLLSVLQAA